MFENIKQNIQEKIEKNGVKIPNITYTDKKGIEHTEDIILKRSRIPLIGDWSRVYPPVSYDEDGKLKWNLINFIFGGRRNFIKLLILLGMVAMMLLAYREIAVQYSELRTLCEPFLEMGLK